MDWGAIWPVIGTVLVALLGTVSAVMVARANSQKDIKAAASTAEESARKTINDSFQLVIGALERRVESQEAEFRRERDAWREQLREEREEFDRERKELTDQIVSLKDEVKKLNTTVIRLERELRRNNLDVPSENHPEHTQLLEQLRGGS